jgi:hypothetical protein
MFLPPEQISNSHELCPMVLAGGCQVSARYCQCNIVQVSDSIRYQHLRFTRVRQAVAVYLRLAFTVQPVFYRAGHV